MDGSPDVTPLYERDFAAWAEAQAKALRARDLDAIDWENMIEEMESLGQSQRTALSSAIRRLLEHQIKLDYGRNREPERGWLVSIVKQQAKIEGVLEANPSLRRELAGRLTAEWPRARRIALASFAEHEPERLGAYEAEIPQECPYDASVIGR